MLSVSYTGKKANSASKTSGVKRVGASEANNVLAPFIPHPPILRIPVQRRVLLNSDHFTACITFCFTNKSKYAEQEQWFIYFPIVSSPFNTFQTMTVIISWMFSLVITEKDLGVESGKKF